MQPRRIALFGTYDERAHPRVRVLREGLVAAGHQVDVVNVALDLDTAARVELVKKPWTAPLVGLRVLWAWLGLARRFRSLDHTPDAVIVGYLGALDVHLARLLFPGPVILDQAVTLGDTVRDRDLTQRSAIVRLLDRADCWAASASDLILVDTIENIGTIPKGHRAKGVVVPVGAPSAWEHVSTPRDAGPMRVVFHGLYTPLQGAPTIGRAIGLLADNDGIEFSMIGKGQDLAETRRLASKSPHVTWHDWVEAEDLPGVVAAHQVCLGIFGTGDKALRVVPNKVYQGAAAGCAIVTSDTPPQRSVLADAAIYIDPGDAEGLADALRSLSGNVARLADLQAASAATATERFMPASIISSLDRKFAELLTSEPVAE